MFSSRMRWDAPLNELTIERGRRSGLLDLTESNPTRAGFDYPLDEIADVMARASRARYDPEPRGLLSAREALAEEIGCSPDELLITASTSEAYSFLFKLLTNPGEQIATAIPSYPLLEQLASLELTGLRTFELEFHRRWEIAEERLREALQPGVRAIAVVNPNNPTGSFADVRERELLASAGLPLISDEVFLDYGLDSVGSTLADNGALTFTLSGLSKSAGLPHFKLGWIRATGLNSHDALDALELISDNFLSAATPVQVALPDLLRIGRVIRPQIQQRTRGNLALLRSAFDSVPAVEVLPVEGGWSAVLRFPRVMTDDDLVLALLDRGVLVQPGWFFDFPRDGYAVVSLLTRTEVFEAGAAIIASFAREVT